MTQPKNIKVIRGILTFFRIGYGLFWFTAGIVAVLAIILPFSTKLQNEFCRLPIGFALKNSPADFSMAGTTYSTRIIRANGYLAIEDGPLVFSYLDLLSLMVFLVVGLYVMRQIILLIKRVNEGEIFILKNILALQRISVALIALWCVSIVLDFFFKTIVALHSSSDILTFGGFLDQVDISGLTLPLLLLVLSKVFQAGLALKKDQDLTI